MSRPVSAAPFVLSGGRISISHLERFAACVGPLWPRMAPSVRNRASTRRMAFGALLPLVFIDVSNSIGALNSDCSDSRGSAGTATGVTVQNVGSGTCGQEVIIPSGCVRAETAARNRVTSTIGSNRRDAVAACFHLNGADDSLCFLGPRVGRLRQAMIQVTGDCYRLKSCSLAAATLRFSRRVCFLIRSTGRIVGLGNNRACSWPRRTALSGRAERFACPFDSSSNPPVLKLRVGLLLSTKS